MKARERGLSQLEAMVTAATRIVGFTGAGISTECGIPDFRSPGGVWSKFQPVEFSDFMRSPDMRLTAWRRYFHIHDAVSRARPGRGHRALFELAQRGKLSHVVTQNIDNLHQDSGLAPDQVIELHGNGTYAKCLACGQRHEISWARSFIAEHARPPACLACDGIVKTATISFGQAMPEAEMARAHGAIEACDLLMAIGSSLIVYPAAGLPLLAKRWGAQLVIINREATDLDDRADLVVHADIGETLQHFI
ncbi:MAG: Sir2 family NAD-dependent protein deacetylase [Pseudomonadota bacterium]|nr:Sir2 family NAD-dependent protein deacetylase [Pseudomonadota bacterium]